MWNENDRRVFRAHLLGAIADAQEKVENLDVGDADRWSANLREIFMATDKASSMAINAMNSWAVQKIREREEKRSDEVV